MEIICLKNELYKQRHWNCDNQNKTLEMKSPSNRMKGCFHWVYQYTKDSAGINQKSYKSIVQT